MSLLAKAAPSVFSWQCFLDMLISSVYCHFGPEEQDITFEIMCAGMLQLKI